MISIPLHLFCSGESPFGVVGWGVHGFRRISFQFRYIVDASCRGCRASGLEGAVYFKTYFVSISLHMFSQLRSCFVLRREGGVPDFRRISFSDGFVM